MRAALSVAAELAECGRPADLEVPLRRLPDLIGADTMGVGSVRWPSDDRVDLLPEVAHPDIFDDEALAVWSENWREHPIVVRQLRGFEPHPLKLSDFLSRRQWERLSIKEAYRRLGLRWEISLHLRWDRGASECLTMHRVGRDFGEREGQLLAILLPHLRAARRRIAAREEDRRRRRLLEQGLDQGAPMVMLDAGGRIVFAADAACRALRRWFGTGPAGDRLPDEVEAWLREQERLPVPEPLVRRERESGVELRVIAAEEGERLLLVDERRDAPDPAALALALPLTHRQAEILARIAAGDADAAIAQRLGVSPRTVGNHVSQILRRLGVSSRTAAALRAQAAVSGPVISASGMGWSRFSG